MLNNLMFSTTDQRSCVAAGYSGCCISSCYISGGCYCDSLCHAARDCCLDIKGIVSEYKLHLLLFLNGDIYYHHTYVVMFHTLRPC